MYPQTLLTHSQLIPSLPAALSSPLPQVLREYARQERVKALIADATTPEHAIAARAFARIEGIVGELGCDAELVPMACQAAEILLMMRQVGGGGGCQALGCGAGGMDWWEGWEVGKGVGVRWI
jgi:hypothetical protein